MRRHPWVFSGAIMRHEGAPRQGDTVEVISADGDFVAWAAFSPHSQIRARAWSYDQKEKIDEGFFRRKIADAIELRKSIGIDCAETNALRLVFSESDGLPGLIADRYGDVIVAQFLSAGAEANREIIADALMIETGLGAVYERSDADIRDLEGLASATGALRGNPPETVEVMENGLKYFVDIARGHKTGFYIDQRDNRRLLRERSAGKDVLNCFCYTGGFTVNALAGGAKCVMSVDSSEGAVDLAKANVKLNGFREDKCDWMCADVFETLREFEERKEQFDTIILDPPRFAQGAEQLEKAGRAYKDINMRALKILKPGGMLFTFSCSGAVSAAEFQKIVAWAAKDAGAPASVVMRLSQGPDHPVALGFPEAEYLKGLVVIKN